MSELELDGKGLPVLLLLYLKLNAKMIAFNIDVNFSNVLDVFVDVYLPEVPSRFLTRYIGKGRCEE